MDMYAASDSPGPGAYDVHKAFKKTTHEQTGNTLASRHNIKNEAKNNPGPSDYYPSTQYIDKTQTGIKFKGRHNQDAKNLIPGPGNYNPGSLAKRSPAFTLSSRFPAESKELKPGPSDYNVTQNNTGPKVTMSYRYSETLNKTQLNNPGVGQYLPEYNAVLKTSPKITMSGRFDQSTTAENNPGPGQYSPNQEYVMNHAPALSLSSRVKKCTFKK
ncbi:H-SHIPPO_1 [Hexamita inflata]|uniref:H-SHIPPO 1 n=1 Tax=Hexamita inflata TaxID=28002 RepID=A0AA86RYV2_9EUKA|nr:H-SHIPPO 1 [Hexamita inflata]CAI9975020.1 H-SHIPPO 1 [Hexamita inflata]